MTTEQINTKELKDFLSYLMKAGLFPEGHNHDHTVKVYLERKQYEEASANLERVARTNSGFGANRGGF